MNRRVFLHRLPLAAGAIASTGSSARSQPSPDRAVLRFGLIADVHQDIMHDAEQRVAAFVAAMTSERPDFVVQLGDFCWPHERNRGFLGAWNRFAGPRHHVLGNHDMDGGFSREQTVAFYGMPARHYAFRHRGVKFVVLDGNDRGGAAAGYARYVAGDQLLWLAAELAEGTDPVVVFIHQALDEPGGIENQAEVRSTLEKARLASGAPRVLAVFAGHHHQDWVRTLADIHYIQINSASYHWVGEAHAHESFSAAIHRDHPWIRMTCPYRDPLWAMASIDLHAGELVVEGRSSEWVGPSPWQLGIPEERLPRNTTSPRISDRRLRVA